MRYVHVFTFQFATKLATYSIQSENSILPYTQFKKLAEEQNINLSTFLNEGNN